MNIDGVKKCIVHADCPDGVMSALLLRDRLQQAEIRFVQYGNAEYKALKPEPGVLYADFSPPVRTKLAFNKQFVIDPADGGLLVEYRDAGTIVLDHHPTAEPVVRAMGDNGVFDSAPGVSGATLVWDYVWSKGFWSQFPRQKTWDMAHLAGIRDTWQRDSPRWRDACLQAAVLVFFPWEHWPSLPDVVARWDSFYREVGEVLLAQREKEVKRCVEGAFCFTSKRGSNVVIFEGPSYSSDVAEAIGDGADVVIAFGYDIESFDQPDGPRIQNAKMRLSTRSHAGYDCATLAKAHGGGGHKAAAGFTIRMAEEDRNPYRFIQDLIEIYEAS